MLTPSEKSRLKWACRRGMLELDVIFMPFFEHEFDGLGGHVTVPDASAPHPQQFSIEAWVNYQDRADLGSQTIMRLGKYTLHYYAGTIVFTSSSSAYRASAALPAGVWTHIVATFDQDGTARLYPENRCLSFCVDVQSVLTPLPLFESWAYCPSSASARVGFFSYPLLSPPDSAPCAVGFFQPVLPGGGGAAADGSVQFSVTLPFAAL